jgi:hypothetical protein
MFKSKIKKIIVAAMIIMFGFTNTAYAFSLSDYFDENKSTYNDLIDTIDVGDDSPLVSAKNDIRNREEAIMNPVNLTRDLLGQRRYVDSTIRSLSSTAQQTLLQEGLIEFNAEEFEYEIPEGIDAEEFERRFNDNFQLDIIDPTRPISSGLELLGANEDWANFTAVTTGVFVFSYDALTSFGELSGIKEIEEYAGAVVTAIASIPLIGGLLDGLGGLFGDKVTTGDVLEKMGIPNAKEILDSARELASPENKSYGGMLFLTVPCGCEPGGNFMLTVMDFQRKIPILLKYNSANPINRLYPFYNVFVPGVYLLGSFNGVNTCVVGVPPLCFPAPVHGNINNEPGTGTSAIPGSPFDEIKKIFGF